MESDVNKHAEEVVMEGQILPEIDETEAAEIIQKIRERHGITE